MKVRDTEAEPSYNLTGTSCTDALWETTESFPDMSLTKGRTEGTSQTQQGLDTSMFIR